MFTAVFKQFFNFGRKIYKLLRDTKCDIVQIYMTLYTYPTINQNLKLDNKYITV